MKLSIIIVAYKAQDYLERCLASIPENNQWEVIVVDNSKINRGFAKGCNLGARKARGEYLLFLNPDTLVNEEALLGMIKVLDLRPDVGIVGPKLVDEKGKHYPSYSWQPTASSAPIVFSVFNRLHTIVSRRHWLTGKKLQALTEVGVVSGAALMIRRADFDQLKGFDERFFMYWEETDLCRRLIALGKKVMYLPTVTVMHALGKTTAQLPHKTLGWFRDSRYRFFRKHFGFLYALAAETFLVALEEWRLLLVLVWAAFLRFYSIHDLMPFLGDQARDFFAAVQFLETGRVPLLGIESSMPRFSQGPIYVWLLTLLFGVFGRQPEVAGYFAATIGLVSVAVSYLFVRYHLGPRAALASSLILATAPLVVTQARMAFMTSPIPLLGIVYLWSLTLPRTRKNIFYMALAFGLLFQFELAHFPLVVLLVMRLWWPRRLTLSLGRVIWPMGGGLVLGLLPQIIYDFSHRFSQLTLFIAWVGYRVGGFVGLDSEHVASAGKLQRIGVLLWEYFSRFIAWSSPSLAYFFITLLAIAVIQFLRLTRKPPLLVWVMATFLISLIAYVVHGAPSEAYFPVIFVPLAIIFGWFLTTRPLLYRIGLCLIILVGIYHSYFLITHRFLVGSGAQGVSPVASYGAPLSAQRELAAFVLQATGEKQLDVRAIGSGSEFKNYPDNLRYLLFLEGRSSSLEGLPIYFGQGLKVADFPSDTLVYTVEGLSVGVPLGK